MKKTALFVILSMTERLVDITTGKLLEKFGAGNHKPGSGSASAFQGMLAAQMLRTVIELTLEPKRRYKYGTFVSELQKIDEKISKHIYPELERLFQLDSEQFDNVIRLRIQRDSETDQKKKVALLLAAQEALVISTETPLDIAELCLELGNHAEYVFNYGFKSARGDSAVALNCAISGTLSCLSIVELNFATLPITPKTDSLRSRKSDIKLRYEKLSKSPTTSLKILEDESEKTRNFLTSIADFKRGNLADSITSDSDIEKLVRNLQNTIWSQRDIIYKNKTIRSPFDILEPSIVLEKVMEYSFQTRDSLGTHELNGDFFEVAGLIDKSEKLVQISKQFAEETQNFTAAHELGHAILHRQTVLHRDKSLDGSSSVPRSREEFQADKFATFFLMPTKLVEDVFFEIFETHKFIINEASVLAIRGGSIGTLRQKCRNKRGLARLLSTTDYYGGKTFNSLTKIFKVSPATMAIRLEELDLLDF